MTQFENAGYAALRQGLLEFQRAAAASEVAVVFYAGHGIEVDQRNFLVPVTAEQIAAESLYWESVKDSEDLWEFRAYPDRYPDGMYMVLARNRLKRLKVSAGGAASASAKSRGSIEAYSVTGESVWVQNAAAQPCIPGEGGVRRRGAPDRMPISPRWATRLSCPCAVDAVPNGWEPLHHLHCRSTRL